MGQRVLITGISRFLGGKLAQRLERDADIEYVVGVDLDEPEVDLDRTEYVRADIRNPLVVKVIQAPGVDTIVHLAIVTGAMQLFGACQKSERVGRLVMKSPTCVNGADPRDPAMFSEDMSARSVP